MDSQGKLTRFNSTLQMLGGACKITLSSFRISFEPRNPGYPDYPGPKNRYISFHLHSKFTELGCMSTFLRNHETATGITFNDHVLPTWVIARFAAFQTPRYHFNCRTEYLKHLNQVSVPIKNVLKSETQWFS